MKITTHDVVATSTAVTGVSLTNLLLFSNQYYLYLAFISAFIGIISALNDLDEMQRLNASFHTFVMAFKGAFIGFFSAPIMFGILNIFGEQIIKKIGFEVAEYNEIILFIYWGLSLMFSRMFALFFYKKGEIND